MTFFANSGVSFPDFRKETEFAGEQSLLAGSRLWKFFSQLEGNKNREIDEGEINECINELLMAAKTYHGIALALKNEGVGPLTPAEIDLAALHGTQGYYDYRRFGGPDRADHIPVGALYLELAKRLSTLASALRGFDPFRPDGLGMQVFQMMRHWEMAAGLGRVIAVLNARGQF